MTRFSIDILGDKGVSRAIRRLPTAARSSVLKRATLAGATLIADDARRRASRKDGRLRKGIRAYVSRELPNTSEARAGARHSHLVEYGTRSERRPKRGRGMPLDLTGGEIVRAVVGPMPARPFWRPAVAAKSDAAMDKARGVIASEVDRILRT